MQIPFGLNVDFFKLNREYRWKAGSGAGLLEDVKQTSRSLTLNEFIKISSPPSQNLWDCRNQIHKLLYPNDHFGKTARTKRG